MEAIKNGGSFNVKAEEQFIVFSDPKMDDSPVVDGGGLPPPEAKFEVFKDYHDFQQAVIDERENQLIAVEKAYASSQEALRVAQLSLGLSTGSLRALRERMQQVAEKLSGVGPNIYQQASLNRFNEALDLLSPEGSTK
jgi:hypothetical protein